MLKSISTPTSTTTKSAPKRSPEGESVNWLVMQIGWPFPTFIQKELYDAEFASKDHEIVAARLITMFNALSRKIDKALATDAADGGTLDFKYWQKPNERATKDKPIDLRATIYTHPQYDKPWLYVEQA